MISIIIPCFNAERTIGSTIDSALSQGEGCEVIVVNDGSTDSSAAVIAGFGDRVLVEYGSNRGVSAARTRGMQIARGDFLQFLDSDDQLTPGTLAQRRAALVATGADVAYTDWQKLVECDDGSFGLGDVIIPSRDVLMEDAEAACADSRFWAPPAALLYRRALAERIGGWRPTLPVIQDARFLFDAAAQNAKFIHVPGIGALYRVTAHSLSRRSRANFLHDCYVNAVEIEADWRQRNALTPRRLETLRAMWRQSALAALIEATPDFEHARKAHNHIAKRHFAIEAGWILRKGLGWRCAGAVGRWELARRARNSLIGSNR
jgi:glycosyltransferase involved in cell wall biosynthesis